MTSPSLLKENYKNIINSDINQFPSDIVLDKVLNDKSFDIGNIAIMFGVSKEQVAFEAICQKLKMLKYFKQTSSDYSFVPKIDQEIKSLENECIRLYKGFENVYEPVVENLKTSDIQRYRDLFIAGEVAKRTKCDIPQFMSRRFEKDLQEVEKRLGERLEYFTTLENNANVPNKDVVWDFIDQIDSLSDLFRLAKIVDVEAGYTELQKVATMRDKYLSYLSALNGKDAELCQYYADYLNLQYATLESQINCRAKKILSSYKIPDLNTIKVSKGTHSLPEPDFVACEQLYERAKSIYPSLGVVAEENLFKIDSRLPEAGINSRGQIGCFSYDDYGKRTMDTTPEKFEAVKQWLDECEKVLKANGGQFPAP